MYIYIYILLFGGERVSERGGGAAGASSSSESIFFMGSSHAPTECLFNVLFSAGVNSKQLPAAQKTEHGLKVLDMYLHQYGHSEHISKKACSTTALWKVNVQSQAISVLRTCLQQCAALATHAFSSAQR